MTLDVAADLLFQHGISAVTFERVAARAAVSKAGRPFETASVLATAERSAAARHVI